MSGLVGLVFLVALIVVGGIPSWVIGKRRNVENAWLAFIPFVGPTIVMLWSMGRTGWLCLLAFIPLVNLVFSLWLVFSMPAAHGRTRWWGLGLLVPLIGIYAYALTLEDRTAEPATVYS